MNVGRRTKNSLVISLILAVLMLITCFTTACQPTPEEKAIVSKGDGKLEKIIAGEPAPTETSFNYQVPKGLQYDLIGSDDFKVQVKADVIVPNAKTYPVMSAKPDSITQQQADQIVAALLKGKTLYKPTMEQDKSQIQARIDYYNKELEFSTTEEQKEVYQGFLTNLMEDYEKATDSVHMEPANTKLVFNKDLPQLTIRYGKEEEAMLNGEPVTRYVWTEEALHKAEADGWKGIYGVTAHVPGERQMELLIKVNADNSENAVYFQEYNYFGHISDRPYASIEGLSLEQATEQAEALLKQMDMLDFSLASADTLTSDYNNYHMFHFKRNISGVSQTQVSAAHLLSMPEYAPPYTSEFIYIEIDNTGIINFYWSGPSVLGETENENAPLLSFDQVESIFKKQIVLQNKWSQRVDKDVVSRRIVINRVQLSYMPIQRANETDTYLYVPVWDFCGQLINKYRDDYSTKPGGFIVDENNELMILGEKDDTFSSISFLTINAIDGSVIDRNRGY